MSIPYFDTSALIKRYHPETGSEVVNRFLERSVDRPLISRLAFVEFHSAVAKKARTGSLSAEECRKISGELRLDIKAKNWNVIRLLVADYVTASDCL